MRKRTFNRYAVTLPDPKFNDLQVAKFVNNLMYDGKKTKAFHIFYAAMDIVADVHRLSAAVGQEAFDIILSCSTFEHLKYPHLAALELLKALRPGGLVLVQTHQAFPVHGYPHDYYRYTREGLAALFGGRLGCEVLATDYEFPASLHARRVPGLAHQECWLNTRLLARKVGPTPAD